MSLVTLSGNVDTLASGKRWLVEIDFNEQQPNLISEENDTAFTTGVGNWYYQFAPLWDSSGALMPDGNSTAGNYMELRTNSVNRLVLPMEKGKRYRFSVRAKASEVTDIRLGFKDLWHYDHGFTLPADGTYAVYSFDLTYSDHTSFRDPRLYLDSFFDQNNEVYIDYIRLECLDAIPISDSSFAVVEFGDWSYGNQDLKPAYVDGIKTSLTIRPLGGGMTDGFKPILLDWLTAFKNNVARVRFWDVTDEEPVLVWRGKVDQSSVSIEVLDNTVSFDVLDFAIANAEVECASNPFSWDIENIGAPLNAYRTLEELFKTYCNYMSPFILADTFYTSVVSDDTMRGWDNLNRFATITGWDNSGTIVKLGIYAYRYFGNYNSPYASTLGELLNDMAYALQVKITPWLYGNVLISAVYPVESDTVAISDSALTTVEQGIMDFDTRGAIVTSIGTRTLSIPPFSNFTMVSYLPSVPACVDGTGQRRKNVDALNLMFFSDWTSSEDSNTMVADLVSQSVGGGGVITQSYFVNSGTYVAPTRFSATYLDNGDTVTTPWMVFSGLNHTLLQLGYIKPKKYLKISLTGVVFDPTKYYTVSWDSSLYRIQAQTINWVDNETELYLIEV